MDECELTLDGLWYRGVLRQIIPCDRHSGLVLDQSVLLFESIGTESVIPPCRALVRTNHSVGIRADSLDIRVQSFQQLSPVIACSRHLLVAGDLTT